MEFKQTFLITVLTGIIVFLIFAVTSKDTKAIPKVADQPSPTVQEDPMASHHGGSKPADSTLFNSLIGKKAPDFTLESYDGKKYSLNSLKGKDVILFFNEGLMCYPACWNQIAAFGTDQKFNDGKTIALSIVEDRKIDWKSAVDKMPELAGSLVLFDTNKSVSALYGVLSLPSSMHKGQFPGHSYVIINKEGVVKFAKDDVQMAVRNKEILSELEKFN